MEETLAPTHELVLQLATEQQVHAFDLKEIFRVAIGRHHSNDVQIRSKRVSNYHAEILSEVDGLFVRDLGSTNGTFVNEETVRRERLRSGDRLKIGNVEIAVRLLPRDGSDQGTLDDSGTFTIGSRGNLVPFQKNAENATAAGRGLMDISLPDLLTRLTLKGASAMIVIRQQSESGRVFLQSGRVVHCECGTVRKEKALFRLLSQQKGTYEIFDLPATDSVPVTIELPTETLIIEGMQQIEMLENLSTKLPPLVYEIALEEKCDIPVSALSPEELEIYQALIRYQTIVRVLEECPLTDFTILRVIHGLLQKKIFRSKRGAGELLDETSFSQPNED